MIISFFLLCDFFPPYLTHCIVKKELILATTTFTRGICMRMASTRICLPQYLLLCCLDKHPFSCPTLMRKQWAKSYYLPVEWKSLHNRAWGLGFCVGALFILLVGGHWAGLWKVEKHSLRRIWIRDWRREAKKERQENKVQRVLHRAVTAPKKVQLALCDLFRETH